MMMNKPVKHHHEICIFHIFLLKESVYFVQKEKEKGIRKKFFLMWVEKRGGEEKKHIKTFLFSAKVRVKTNPHWVFLISFELNLINLFIS